MNTLDIIDRQIFESLYNRTMLRVFFLNEPDKTHDKKVVNDFIILCDWSDIEQGNDIFIHPAFCKTKRISKDLYNDLLRQAEKFDGYLEDNGRYISIIKTELSYNEFYDKYYNSQKSINK